MPITRQGYFKPIQIGNCLLWLDGTDPTGTGTAPTNGSTLTTWVDKSGNGRNLIVGSGTTTYSNNAITLASSYMYVSSAIDLTNFTFFIVTQTNSATNNQTVFGARPNTTSVLTSSDGFGFYMDSQTAIRFFGNNTASQFINQSISTSSPNMFSFASGSTVINGWFNGNPVSGASGLTTRTSSAQGFAIGAEWSGSAYGNTVSTASIYEIIVYNSSLGTSQQQVEAYLSQKWGLTALLPQGHPGLTSILYRSVPIKITTTRYYTQFSPTSIPGASLWLDAADAASVGTVTSYGANSGVVTTLAGSVSGFTDGTGTDANFSNPWSVAILPNGNIVVADYSNKRIRLITTSTYALNSGVVTTLAGNNNATFVDGTGAAASFSYPAGVAVIPSSSIVVVADGGNNRIRLINSATGVVTTLAGNATATFADGTGATASFNSPLGVAYNPTTGNIVVADTGNHRIRLITYPGGVVTTLAGSGVASYDDGTGTAANFNRPSSVAYDPTTGNIVVADTYSIKIRLITPGGVVTTAAGNTIGSPGFADGTGSAASFSSPYGVAVLSNGTIVVADTGNNRIRLVTPLGVVTTIAGNATGGGGDGTGTAASFYNPSGVAVLSNGTIVVADQSTNKIRLVAPSIIQAWNDKSGQGNHVTSTVGGILTNNAMTFNGTNQAFSNTSYVFPYTAYSMFAVFSNTTAPAATSYMNAVYGSGGYPMLGVYDVNKYVSARSVVANTGALITNISASSNVLVSATYIPSTFSPFINGTPETTLAGTTLAATGIYIGGPLNYFNGSISEVIIYSTTLSANQRQTVESYLSQKWGLTKTLPASHINNTFPAGSPAALQLYITTVNTNLQKIAYLPGIPTIATPTNIGNIATLTMTWTAPAIIGSSGTVSGYIVYILAGGNLVAGTGIGTGGTQTLGNVLTASFSPMTTNLNYSYYVAATGPGGTGVVSSTSTPDVFYYAPPSAPTVGTAANTGNLTTLTMTWTAGSGTTTYYTVYVVVGGSTVATLTPGNVLTTTYSPMTTNLAYTFYVTATNTIAAATSGSSATSGSAAYYAPPGQASVSTPTNTGNSTTLTMNWTAASGTVTNYTVYVLANNIQVAGTGIGTGGTQALGNVLTASFSPMTTNVPYTFYVIALNNGIAGSPSTTSSSAFYYIPPVGGSITLASALTVSSGSVTITAATNATSYTVYISTTTSSAQSVYQFTTSTTGSAVSFTPSPSLTVSTTYYAVLLPVNVSIPGTYSNSTSVATPPLPTGGSIVLNSGLTINSGTVTITAATGATGYRVYISTTTSIAQSVFNFATALTGSAVSFATTTNLTLSTTYYAVLIPYNSSGDGSTSFSSGVVTPAPVALYTYTSPITFTPAGATGRSGPTLSQCKTSYASYGTWVSNTSYFNMTTQGYQRWTIPTTGSYTFVCAGAQGGYGTTYTWRGGTGFVQTATFSLIQGNIISIVVGQIGPTGSNLGGGGGGTFIYNTTTSTLLMASGGGGGTYSIVNGSTSSFSSSNANADAVQSTAGKPGIQAYTNGNASTGGTNGSGGSGGSFYTSGTNAGSAGGGGYTGDGGIVNVGNNCGATGGFNFSTGNALGGVAQTTNPGYAGGGGFGGGGSGDYCATQGGGGGGGYSGGGGGAWGGVGGGGGSYSSVVVSSTGTNTGDGYITATVPAGTPPAATPVPTGGIIVLNTNLTRISGSVTITAATNATNYTVYISTTTSTAQSVYNFTTTTTGSAVSFTPSPILAATTVYYAVLIPSNANGNGSTSFSVGVTSPA